LTAYENARSAFNRLNNGKPATKQLRENKKLQREMRQAAEALRDAGVAMTEGPKKKRRGGFGKLILIAIIGFGVALVVREDLRNRARDALFGGGEEFDSTSTTAPPPAPAPSEPVSSSNS